MGDSSFRHPAAWQSSAAVSDSRLWLCCAAGSSKAGSMALHEEGPGLQAAHSPSSSAAVSQSPWEDLSLSDSIAPQESSHVDPLRPSSSAGKNLVLLSMSQCLTCLAWDQRQRSTASASLSDWQITAGKARRPISCAVLHGRAGTKGQCC